MNFKKVTLEDKAWIKQKLKESDFQGAEYSFTNIYVWKNEYKIEIAEVDNALLVKSESQGKVSFLFPIGKCNVEQVLQKMIEYADEQKIPLKIHGILPAQKELFSQNTLSKFNLTSQRHLSDYIYETEKMTTLSGKKLQSKRNHIARFKDNAEWQLEEITADNIKECIAMTEEWCKANNCKDNSSLLSETCATKITLNSFLALEIQGLLLRLQGKVVAYTIGEKLNSDTFIVYIEKAFGDIQGAYPFINQQFAIQNALSCKYINREDDAGDEGLRKAKLSYSPVYLLEKYQAVLLP